MNIDKACEIIYEAITGKCWHGDHISEWKDDIDDRHGGRYLVKHECGKCHKRIIDIEKETDTNSLTGNKGTNLNNCNPNLATSHDAWHKHIFPAMSDEQREQFVLNLTVLMQSVNICFASTADYITAALELEVECGKCEGTGQQPCNNECDMQMECGQTHCDCTCTNGRIKLKDKLPLEADEANYQNKIFQRGK